jgi:hypothetical protein
LGHDRRVSDLSATAIRELTDGLVDPAHLPPRLPEIVG